MEDAMAFMRNYAEEHFQTEVAFMRKHEYRFEGAFNPSCGFFRKLDELENDLMMFGPSQALADRALDITQDWFIDISLMKICCIRCM
ncbi:hypothetical protein [Chromatium okenii]|uniref:hypothetical protein n=1 Tax=Chromatium okenii TaxID=61644 RepID=UPI003221B494